MSKEDLEKVVSGEMADDEKEELSVKTILEFVNLFTTMSSEDVEKCKRVETIVVNKKCSKVDNVVTAESTIDDYELGDFSIIDTGIINFDGDIMFK